MTAATGSISVTAGAMVEAAEESSLIVGLDHIQLALPAGTEDKMQAFYCDILGMIAQPKPAPLQGRGGFWASTGTVDVHFGVDPDFHPATKAHPAFIVRDSEGVFTALTAHGHTPAWDTALPKVKRFFVMDPVGNRIEIIEQT